MTSPEPQPPDRLPLARIVAWCLVALALVVGVILFIKYAGAVAPVLDSKVGQ
jgi:hypothetical protein